MERISRILLITGLVLVLCVPALTALANEEPPVKPSPCTEGEPDIDGWVGELTWVPDVTDGERPPPLGHWEWDWSEEWADAHKEIIGPPPLTSGEAEPEAVNPIPPPIVHLAIMNDGHFLYLALVEIWSDEFLDGGSAFFVGFEDDGEPFVWDKNAQGPPPADEGWLVIMGRPECGFLFGASDGEVSPASPPWIEWKQGQGVSHPVFVGRRGGDRGEPPCFFDCVDDPFVFDEETGAVSAFTFDKYPDLGAGEEVGERPVPPPLRLVFVHEVAIDLENSPLNVHPGECYRGFFAATNHYIPPCFQAEAAGIPEVIRDVWCNGRQSVIGWWPNGWEAGDPDKDFKRCCWPPLGADRLFNGPCYPAEDCDWCLECYGEVCLEPCEGELLITKAVDRSQVYLGEQVEFTLTVTNPGPSVAPDVEVTDELDACLRILGVEPSQGTATLDGQKVTWTVGEMGVGDTASLTILVQVNCEGVVENIATLESVVLGLELDSNLVLVAAAIEFVPEPGTIVLLGSGLASLAGWAGLHWRRRK